MLEHYYVKPSTIDRIRDSWLGSQIESYVGWMEANGYTSRTVFRRMPRLFCFAEFAQKRGCTDVASALLSSRNLYPNGWFSMERKEKHPFHCASMQLILGMPHVRCCGWQVVEG
jgi:hypothetical protein